MALPQPSSGAATNQRSATRSESNDEIVGDFIWDIAALNTHLEDIRRAWARLLGISGPQSLQIRTTEFPSATFPKNFTSNQHSLLLNPKSSKALAI
jgi:hypothetical protein